MRKTQVVVLRVSWDDEDDYVDAAEWEWTDLAGSECEVIAAGPLTISEEEE
jgi:hypothetical protein